MNKEDHANKIQEIVYQYFMNQRIKPVDASDEAALEKYHHELTLLHHMLVYSMKTKQSLATENTDMLKSLVGEFAQSYFGEKIMEKHHH
jgi:nickel superoxide dismutase